MRIALADDFYLYDTPGVLWPRIIVEQSGYNLAASGAIGVNAFDEEVVALELLNYLIPHYSQALSDRYKVTDVASHTDESLLEAIGRVRGAMQSGGRINSTKAAHIVIHDFRTAALGRVTLETPEEFAAWLAEGKIADAERAVRKEAIEKNKKTAFKSKKR
jgi:ribosome biogenesis GTPase A